MSPFITMYLIIAILYIITVVAIDLIVEPSLMGSIVLPEIQSLPFLLKILAWIIVVGIIMVGSIFWPIHVAKILMNRPGDMAQKTLALFEQKNQEHENREQMFTKLDRTVELLAKIEQEKDDGIISQELYNHQLIRLITISEKLLSS